MSGTSAGCWGFFGAGRTGVGLLAAGALDAGVVLAVDVRTRTDFSPIWVSPDEVLVDGPQGIAVVRPDGSSQLLVAETFPCLQHLIDWVMGIISIEEANKMFRSVYPTQFTP